MTLFKSLFVFIAASSVAQAAPILTPAPCNLQFSASYQEGQDFSCHQLSVPVRHQDPTKGSYKLHVLRIKSPFQSPGIPTVMLNGGPGDTLEWFFQSWIQPNLYNPAAKSEWMGAFLKQGDVILYDQRGSGKSEPQTSCQNTPSVEDCIKAVQQKGVDVTTLTTLESAEDLQDLKLALGGKINLYGLSYGTYLAQKHLKYHPDGVQKVVLQGVMDATQFEDVDQGAYIEHIIGLCEESPVCAKWYPTLKVDYAALLDQAAQKPVVVRLGGQDLTIDQKALKFLIFVNGYDRAQSIPKVIDQLAVGDFAKLVQEKGIYLTAQNPFGSVMAQMMGGHMYCAAHPQATPCTDTSQPFQPDPADYNAPLKTDLPVLLLSGQLDPRTPPSQAEQVRPGLKNHLHVVLPAGGHGSYGNPQEFQCTLQILSGFLESGTAVNQDCLQSLPPLVFASPF
ncbi:alpha/beta hydrolase [Deinococcus roseus]|uniref:Alpha/beta hydrolase n=1 Tax=Deinococcus roseus TaxID=392414 RepID=A0ABQ2D2D7_9DEIO|nr:alpha/beta hydrolase [Deinococcus roseus]GGJ43083.1 alpha/beta hydrolase [Deinococcus roseus]